MVAAKNAYNGNVDKHADFLVGIAVSVGACIVIGFALISCIYFRKWKYRRRPSEDAAFYTNAGFDNFPQEPAKLITKKKMKQNAGSEVHPANNAPVLCTLSDLPPYPAADTGKLYPFPYQLDPEGYVEQNLFATHSVNKSPQQDNSGGTTRNLSTDPSEELVLYDILYANPGAKDVPQDPQAGIVDGAESGYETVDLKDSPDEIENSIVIGNPSAFIGNA